MSSTVKIYEALKIQQKVIEMSILLDNVENY